MKTEVYDVYKLMNSARYHKTQNVLYVINLRSRGREIKGTDLIF